MTWLWIGCLWVLWGAVNPAWAQLYRWKDAAGRTHFTDNLATIPDAYRGQAQEISARPGTSEPRVDTPLPARTPSPRADETTSRTEGIGPAQWQKKIQELEQNIAAARQERQEYLNQLNAVRPLRTNPAFGRKRREVADIGQSLAAVERQLDTLEAALQQAQGELAASQDTTIPEAQGNRPGGDRQRLPAGETAAWRQRFQTAQERVRQLQEQRQAVLAQLSADNAPGPGATGRQGRTVIQHAQTLQRIEQEMHTAEAAMQALHSAADQAGVPQEWRQ